MIRSKITAFLCGAAIAIGALLGADAAHAQSTINTGQPATRADLNSLIVRELAQDAATDINGLLAGHPVAALASCPASPYVFTDCLVTGVSPYQWYKYTGTAGYGLVGTIDPTTGTISLGISSATLQQTYPIALAFSAGVATVSLQYDSNFTNNSSNQLALNNGASGCLIGNSSGGSAEPSCQSPNQISAQATLGSWWSDQGAMTPYPIFRMRDRACVDDGCLISAAQGAPTSPLPNIRSGADLNAVGGGWVKVPSLASLYVLSSQYHSAIAGQTSTSGQTCSPCFGYQSAIGVTGMSLSNNATIGTTAWGGYFQGAKLTTNANYAYGVEIDVDNAYNSVVTLPIYGTPSGGPTTTAQLDCGGLAPAAITYNCSAALYIITNPSGGTPEFDRGIVFGNSSVADQGGGVFNAVNFPTNYRVNWWRNNSGADQLQAYIAANDTTVGANVMSLVFGASDTATLTADIIALAGGVVVGSPTGGNQGAGTVNATGLYVNGVAVSAGSAITSGTAGQFAYYASTGTVLSGATTGSGVVTAIGDAVNTNGGLLTGTTAAVATGAVVVGAGSGSAPTGIADVAPGALLSSGGVGASPVYCTVCLVATSFTSPVLYGGSSAGSSLALTSTSNGSPSGDSVTISTGGLVRETLLSGGNIGFGTETNPQAPFVVSENASTGINFITYGVVDIGAAGGGNAGFSAIAFGTSAGNSSIRYNGTWASPTALAATDIIGSFSFIGYNGSALTSGARVLAQASDTWTTSDKATFLEFDATPVGSNTRAAVAIMQAGIQVGAAPAGGDKGAGTINVATGVYLNGTAYTNPDYALEDYFTGKIVRFAKNPGASSYKGLLPLDQLEGYMRAHEKLPGMGRATGRSVDIFERADIALEKTEELAIYITQLKTANDNLKNEIQTLRKRASR